MSRRLIASVRPSIVAGFGGYTTLPALFAASRMGVPTLIHEQNAVMGRANALLAKRVTAIAGGFLPEAGAAFPDKTLLTGNPVRPAVLEAAKTEFVRAGESRCRSIFWSLAAARARSIFPKPFRRRLRCLDGGLRKRLVVTQQARREDEAAVKRAYEEMGIAAEVSPFFDNMAGRIAASHFVISRAGASTVSEIAAIGRPSPSCSISLCAGPRPSRERGGAGGEWRDDCAPAEGPVAADFGRDHH